jgi:peroxiredoxin (alkyl hydroperoxide reductase subunit C)
MLIDNLKVIKIQEEQDTGACEISSAQSFLNLV